MYRCKGRGKNSANCLTATWQGALLSGGRFINDTGYIFFINFILPYQEKLMYEIIEIIC
jgi:hypothetical protein